MGLFDGFFKANVEKLKKKEDFNGLIKLLNDEDPNVRYEAIDALGVLGVGDNKKYVFPHLEKLIKFPLKNDQIKIQMKKEQKEFCLKQTAAIEKLIKALNDENAAVRNCAAHALRDIGLMSTPLGNLRIGSKQELEFRQLQTDTMGGTKTLVEPLIKALNDEDFRVRSFAAEALGFIGDDRAVEPLIEALKNGDSYLRKRAAWALSKINVKLRAMCETGDDRAVEPLIEAALNDEDSDVRQFAANSLHIMKRSCNEQDDRLKAIMEFSYAHDFRIKY
jgi:HEAT repeat protein